MTTYAISRGCAALFLCGLAAADVKITANYNTDGKASETTIYANGARVRYEYGKGLVLLRQCDLNRIVQVDDKSRTYLILPAEVPATIAASGSSSPSGKTEVTDTNEHKDLFGYPARHLKLTTTTEEKAARTETDGWYIDLKDVNSCSGSQPSAGGYPVSYSVTTYLENGKPGSTVTMRVTSLVTAPIDPQLFEIPRQYVESTPQAAALKVAPKAAGAIRIGAVATDNPASAKMQTATAYNQLVAQLQAAQFEVVQLPAGSLEAVQLKARETDCDYVLYTEMANLDKPAGGKVGGFLHKAPGIGHIAGDSSEVKVDYRLVPPDGGSPVLAASSTGKGGSSFDWKSAALLASNVLPMTMAARMLGGAFNPAMMGTMMSGRGSGAALTSMDPMMNSLTMFLRATNAAKTPGNPAQNSPAAEAAMGSAFDQVGKAVIAQLKRPSN